MSYQVRFSDSAYDPIIVEDQLTNNELSISFVGKNYVNYAPIISENFLHILENFANSTAPSNPVQGQLWFDNEANYLKLYNGVEWQSVGFMQKSNTPPTNLNVGDLWINTESSIKQLMMYTGSTDPTKEWLLIGPENSYGDSGLFIQTIDDNTISPKKHDIVLLSAKNQNNLSSDTVAVYSRDEFTPKEFNDSLQEFELIKKGINLPTSINSEIKLHGTATRADALVVTSGSEKQAISANRFLRDNKINTVNYRFDVNNADGLSIKDPSANTTFAINLVGSTINLSSLTNDANISFNIKKNNVTSSVLYIDAKNRIGIGTSSPAETLDIFGTVKVNGEFTVTSGVKTLLDVNNSAVTVNTDLVADKLIAGTISYNPALSPTGVRQYNSNNNFIGYLEESSFLAGTWVGTSISAVTTESIKDINGLINDLIAENKVEQLIMSISPNSNVIIDSYISVNGRSLVASTQKIGKIYRIDKNIPYIYFYSEKSDNPSEYGLKLYSVLVNGSKDLATFTLLANGNSSEFTALKKITFFKITDTFSDNIELKNILDTFNASWM